MENQSDRTYAKSAYLSLRGWLSWRFSNVCLIHTYMVCIFEQWVSESCSVVSDSLQPHGLHSPWNSPGHNTGVGSCSLLQGIFPAQGSNPSLVHCGWILYQLSHRQSSRILDWVAYPFSSRSSQPRNQTRISCIARRFLTRPTKLSGKPKLDYSFKNKNKNKQMGPN